MSIYSFVCINTKTQGKDIYQTTHVYSAGNREGERDYEIFPFISPLIMSVNVFY